MQKVDLFLRKSRNNDEFARIVRGRNRSVEGAKLVVAQWRSCNHLFVKVRESEYIGAYHSSDCETIPARYECVKCGLTNRLIDVEEMLDRCKPGHGLLPEKKRVTDETTEWGCQQPKISSKNLLSEELIKTIHPGVLFEIATELCSAQGIKVTRKNVFEVMKELCSMETSTEQIKISTTVHASALIERYKEKHGLYQAEEE